MRSSRLASLAFLLVLACGGEEEASPAPPPKQVFFGPGTAVDGEGAARIDFGEVAAGRQARATLVLENRSDRPLPLEVEAPEAPFSLVDAPEMIPPRALASLVFRFAPTQAASRAQRLALGAGGQRLWLRLEGATAPVDESCSFTLSPEALRLTVGPEDPGLDWKIPFAIEVEEGRCKVEEARAEGDLAISFEGLEGMVFYEGTRTEVTLAVEAPAAGQEGAAALRIGGREAKLPLRVEAEPSCVSANPPEVRIEDGLHCQVTTALEFGGACGEAPRLVGSTLLGEGTGDLSILVEGETTSIGYTAEEAHREARATAVFDFANGDRLYLPVTARVGLAETRVLIPERRLDLLLLADKGSASSLLDGAIDRLSDAIWEWMGTSDWEVSVGLTTTAMESEAGCPAEEGRLLPAESPAWITTETPEGGAAIRDRLRAARCGDPPSQGLAALERALQTPPWDERETTKGAVILAAHEDSSPLGIFQYQHAFHVGGLSFLHAIGPCDALDYGRYGALVGFFGGHYQTRCDAAQAAPILDALEKWATWPYEFELEPAAPIGDLSGYAAEEEGIAVSIGEAPLHSGAFPGWVVTEGGSLLRVDWGLEPGTELVVRYPKWRCSLTDDGS